MTLAHFTPDAGYVYVPVEPEHVPAVETLLDGLRGVEPRSIPRLPGDSGDDELRNALWTDKMLGILIDGKHLALEITGEVMDILSGTDEPLNVQQLAEATGRDRSQMQTVWTHLSRHLSATYGHKAWPIEARSGNRFSPPRGGDEVYYWLSPRMAERWRKLRGI